MMELTNYLKFVGDWFLGPGLAIILILILMLVAVKASKLLAERLFKRAAENRDEEYKKRADTLSSVIGYVLRITIFIVGLMLILGELGIEVGPIIAAAGIIGLAVGFGAQSLVKDVISGFFILLQDQIRVGDVVQIAGKGGLVEHVNLKMTILRDLAGNVHYVPNGTIDVVTNMTKDYSRFVFNIGVAYREDVDEVMKVITEIDESLRNDPDFGDDILEPLEILGVDEFADSAVIIKARTKTKPIKQWRIGREFNRRMKKVFDEKNIEIPFPHVTLYAGEDKTGKAPAMPISMSKIESDS
ncbi:mechanosensitive ion channel [candidate division KSB1 bacterium]|nr:mechanosensitive ion channel [candidate division KSB1 bacterium]